ncbi:disease resistance TIR-NBS-LRR class family protein [Tanacetum coccineum]
MHDHIEEMGKNIVRREHPNEPNKHSHLWIDEEIEDILANDMVKIKETRCLKLNKSRVDARIVMKGLGKMKKLIYLEVNYADDHSADYDSESDYESDGECLASDPKFDDTSQFDIPNSLKYLKFEKEEEKVLKKLKFLYLFESNLTTIDFRITPNLETLYLVYSPNLKELCMPVSCQKLKFLYIGHSKLRTFDLRLTPNLETLSIFYGTHFEGLHVSVACPNLKFIKLYKSRLRSLDLELIPNLKSLDLQYSDALVEINAPVGCLNEVVYLYLNGCLRFPYFVFRGRGEPNVNCSSATLILVGESLDLCPLHPNSNLPKLRIRCYYEEYLPSSESLNSKAVLKILSSEIKHLPDSMCMLKHLKSLGKLPEDLGKLECLEKLHVRSETIESLPDSICMLKRLKSLDVLNCCRLGKLPEDIGQLESLERLALWATEIKRLPDSICMLKHMKYLTLFECALLEKLPEDLGRLECLEHLDITYTSMSSSAKHIWVKGLLIEAPPKLLQLYDFPSEIKTRASPIQSNPSHSVILATFNRDSCKHIMNAARTTNAKTIGPVPLPTKKRICLDLPAGVDVELKHDHCGGGNGIA